MTPDGALVVQQDYVPKTETTDILCVDAKHRDSWRYFTWLCTSEPSLGESARDSMAGLSTPKLVRQCAAPPADAPGDTATAATLIITAG